MIQLAFHPVAGSDTYVKGDLSDDSMNSPVPSRTCSSIPSCDPILISSFPKQKNMARSPISESPLAAHNLF